MIRSEMLHLPHSATFFTLHHPLYGARHLLPSFPNRLANATDISGCHRRCLVSKQVSQDVRSNARRRCLGHYGAPQIVQLYVLKASLSNNLNEMLPHGAVGNRHRSRAGEHPYTETGKVAKDGKGWLREAVNSAARLCGWERQTACLKVDVAPLDPQTSPILSPVRAVTRIAATLTGWRSSCCFRLLASAAISDAAGTRSRASSRTRLIPKVGLEFWGR